MIYGDLNRKEIQKRGHALLVYVEIIHFALQQKLTQHHRATVLLLLFGSLVVSDSLQPHGLQHARLLLEFAQIHAH